jgi:signal transduction histidine kinase
VEKEYQPHLPLVPMDESLCEQAFVNLVQNAYDAMGAGGGMLRVQARKSWGRSQTGGSVDGVELRIEDTGPGIPPELREQIFNPFVTTKKSGVGLGLSIVSKIIDGHHGTIRIEAPGDVGGDGDGDSGVAGSGASGSSATGPGAHFVIFFPALSEKAAVGETAHLVIS